MTLSTTSIVVIVILVVCFLPFLLSGGALFKGFVTEKLSGNRMNGGKRRMKHR